MRRRQRETIICTVSAVVLLGPLVKAWGIEAVKSGLFDMFTWHFDGQAFLYNNWLSRTPDSTLNPGNVYARLPNETLTGELRPNMKATSKYLDIVVQPRLSSVFQTGGVESQESVRGYLQEGYVRARPADNVSITAGREVLTWGPAFFRSPSNPYYFDNARLDPIRELSGIDVVRVAYAIDPHWTLTAGLVFGSGHDLVSDDRYGQSLMLKADYQGTNSLASLVVASLRGRSAFVGGYAQTTVDDAIMVYGEAGPAGSPSADAAALPPRTAAQMRLAGTELGKGREATALVGGSYTFAGGQSIYAEYLYNGFGYSGSDLKQYFRQARQAGDMAALGGALGGAAAQDLGSAATRSTDLLGQHYLYLQLQNSQSQGNNLWRLMAAHNLVDHSTQFSFYLEHNITDRISLFALGVADAGSRNSEFGSVLRCSLTVGGKVFLF